MARRTAVVLMMMFVGVSAATAASPQRATWVWNNWVVETPAKHKDFLRFCRARGIGTVFLHAPAEHLGERAATFRAFLAAGHKQGLRVEALDGAPDWAFEPAKPEAFIAAVLAFNDAGVDAGERFDGIHLDVEPYDSPQWKESADETVIQYLIMLEGARASAGALPIAADVPPWFAEIDTPEGPLLGAVIARVNAVALMAYAHQTKQLAAQTRPAVELAQRAHLRVWIGISAQLKDSDMNPNRPVRPQLEALVKITERAFRHGHAFGGFAGVAIHDYENLRGLYDPERRAASADPASTDRSAAVPAR